MQSVFDALLLQINCFKSDEGNISKKTSLKTDINMFNFNAAVIGDGMLIIALIFAVQVIELMKLPNVLHFVHLRGAE